MILVIQCTSNECYNGTLLWLIKLATLSKEIWTEIYESQSLHGIAVSFCRPHNQRVVINLAIFLLWQPFGKNQRKYIHSFEAFDHSESVFSTSRPTEGEV